MLWHSGVIKSHKEFKTSKDVFSFFFGEGGCCSAKMLEKPYIFMSSTSPSAVVDFKQAQNYSVALLKYFWALKFNVQRRVNFREGSIQGQIVFIFSN